MIFLVNLPFNLQIRLLRRQFLTIRSQQIVKKLSCFRSKRLGNTNFRHQRPAFFFTTVPLIFLIGLNSKLWHNLLYKAVWYNRPYRLVDHFFTLPIVILQPKSTFLSFIANNFNKFVILIDDYKTMKLSSLKFLKFWNYF